MTNILNNNRLPLECKLSAKDYWDFCLRVGREYYGYPEGMQTGCLSAYVDTTINECVNSDSSLKSSGEYKYENCISNGIVLNNIGLTGMDNGFISFDKNDENADEIFKELLKEQYTIEEGDCSLHLFSVKGNNLIYTYGNEIVVFDDITCAKLNGGFYQGFFRSGNGCAYSVLPSNIENGLSLEFELYRKDIETVGYTLNDASEGRNKGIFFYMGTRAENKWVRYYGDVCGGEEHQTTNLKTSNNIPLDENTGSIVESDNKYLIYNRSCGEGKTVLDDINEEKKNETVLVETSPVEYPDNLFTVFSRKCKDGITTENFKTDYVDKKNMNAYNPYKDLWNNALGFRITDDGRVGYKYLVKECDNDSPECTYKIESEYSNPNNVPYSKWTTIHVRIHPVGVSQMRLLFYVDGRLVLYSKLLPKLNLRELNDISEKQEGVPFNISLGGGTQGLADVVYEDFKTFYETDYPLQKEFGGSFIGYIKSFKFYSCELNYSQINQNVNTKPKEEILDKIYCGTLMFNTKPSLTPITEQAQLIGLLNEYNNDTRNFTINMSADITKRYTRIVLAVPSSEHCELVSAFKTISGLDVNGVSGGTDITPLFEKVTGMIITPTEGEYDVWYCTYSSYSVSNNIVRLEIR